MFDASRSFLFFDYFRVPYQPVTNGDPPLTGLSARHPLQSCGWIRPTREPARGSSLLWAPSSHEIPGARPPAMFCLDSIPIFCRVLPDSVLGPWLEQAGGGWKPDLSITEPEGAAVASVWRRADGSVFLPFDPAEAIENCWSEGYQTAGGVSVTARAKKLAMRTYYRIRPALPRASQIMLRQMFSRVQGRAKFPRWPVESALHDLYELLFRLAADVAGRPVPWIAAWPEGRSWTLVLTHDVETAVGRDNLNLLRDVESEVGFRSSWNFVPRRYEVSDTVVRSLTDAGFEVGVHGLYHDGRDLESLSTFQERLPAMQESGNRWGAVGFRSPATHRVWEWMPMLGFDYDSSYPDTDPYEPVSGGCCSWLPYFNQNLVELPITLPQDHTLFHILEQDDERTWVEKTEYLRDRGGMALLITHPDYMLESEPRDAYARFLQTFQGDPTLWQALPRDVSAWWRRRADSHVESDGDGYRVVGPAASEAAIRLTV